MLGSLSLLNNSIFLSVRFIALSCALLYALAAPAQIVLKTSHFILHTSPTAARQGELALQRLEEMRSALSALHGPTWIPANPVQVWIPNSEQEWLKTASSAAEQGIYRSTPRKDWIVVNPSAANFIEVVSHEYVHAVLNRALPNLPTWFAEGICEYYSTLELRYRGSRATVSSGRPPGNRMAWLQGVGTIDLESLAARPLDHNGYARAWAAAYQLWPRFEATPTFPKSIAVPIFSPRIETIELRRPVMHLMAVSPAEVAELELDFAANVRNQVQPPVLRGGDQSAVRAQELFVEGLRLADAGEASRATPLLAEACRLRPSNSTWWHALALAYRDANEIDKAREAVGWALSTALNDSETAAAAILRKALD